MKYLLYLSLPFFGLDQLTKWVIRRTIPYGSEVSVIPGFFSLVHVSNTGAAFSLFTGNNLFFVCLAASALAVIAFLLIRDSFQRSLPRPLARTTKISFALLVAGILGNLTDRLSRGAVTDFLHFYVREYAWPSFNVADSCICIAAGLLLLTSFQRDKADAREGR
jgi:signal peptidase II